MNQQQEERHAAAQAFKKSLEQLQQALKSPVENPEAAHTLSQTASSFTTPIAADPNLQIWEDAIADIDQFIQQQDGYREKGEG